MSKALHDLHSELAKVLAKAIKEGVPMKDEESGVVHNAPAPAAILNVARQFLKDNNIQATEENPDVKDLVDNLPTFEGETAFQGNEMRH
jgi:hypothetical protein